MNPNRRKFPRYIPKNIGFHVFSNDLKIAGRLKDISKDGLAFHYAPIASAKKETNLINIVATNGSDRFYMFELECRTIYDIHILSKNKRFMGTESRQCGVQYVKLTKKQQDKLELSLGDNFIKMPKNF